MIIIYNKNNTMEYFTVIILVIMSGLFSGLTLGMFSLNPSSLERKIKLGNKQAKKVYKIRKNGNLLLCTLLLGNVAVNSTLAIFLGTIAPGLIAGLISTGLIVIFGEILPQAVFSRFALTLGSKTSWLVRIFIILLFPIAAPLAFVLDKMLGKELPTIWKKNEIKEIIKTHEDSERSTIDSDEEKFILGVLSFSDKTAESIMTPKTVVYFLDITIEITANLLNEIKSKAFTRIPVYSNTQDNIKGILYTKMLIGLRGDENKNVSDFCIEDKVLAIKDKMKLDNLFNLFINKKAHMAFIYNDFGTLLGIVTLEDVIEEILKTEIIDEADQIKDMQAFAKEKFNKELLE